MNEYLPPILAQYSAKTLLMALATVAIVTTGVAVISNSTTPAFDSNAPRIPSNGLDPHTEYAKITSFGERLASGLEPAPPDVTSEFDEQLASGSFTSSSSSELTQTRRKRGKQNAQTRFRRLKRLGQPHLRRKVVPHDSTVEKKFLTSLFQQVSKSKDRGEADAVVKGMLAHGIRFTPDVRPNDVVTHSSSTSQRSSPAASAASAAHAATTTSVHSGSTPDIRSTSAPIGAPRFASNPHIPVHVASTPARLSLPFPQARTPLSRRSASSTKRHKHGPVPLGYRPPSIKSSQSVLTHAPPSAIAPLGMPVPSAPPLLIPSAPPLLIPPSPPASITSLPTAQDFFGGPLTTTDPAFGLMPVSSAPPLPPSAAGLPPSQSPFLFNPLPPYPSTVTSPHRSGLGPPAVTIGSHAPKNLLRPI